jgi:tetratricopeptide (TPR) repeat protein
MEIGNIFPSKEQITKLKDIESVLLSRKANGKVAGWIAMLSALVQFSIILWPFFKLIFGSISDKEFSLYFRDIKTFLPLCIFITCISIYLLLRRTSILLKETKEPFRYTLTVKPFQQVGKIPESTDKPTESRFSLKNQDRLLLLHHDLTELINQRIKRFLIIPIEITEELYKKEDNKNALIIDKRQSSHIDVFGNYAIREDKKNDEWIIHVMPYVRIGPSDSPATLAQSIRYSLSKDETPDILDTDEYNQIVERVYSRVTTEIYARIEKDIQDKIELFPTRYLKANALYHEARDMANSNTINAFESAINLYNESIRILNITLIKRLKSIFIKMPLIRLIFVRYLFHNAKIYIGHAKCLVYKYRIATLSGRKRNPIFEIRQNLKDIISDLEHFHYNISNNSEISEYKNNKRTYSILAFLTYPTDTFFRQILFRPSRPLFDETRKILFNAYVVHSLTDSLLNAFTSSREYLNKAKAIAPDLINTDPLYILAQAYAEPNIDRALLSLQKATEIDPFFQIAQYDLAFWMEMKFRMNDDIKYNRARSVLDEYDKVLRINPGNIAALAAQGYIYWLLDELDEARRKFEEGYEIKSIVSETFIGQLIYGRARIFAEQGRINQCYDLFNQAFVINPNVGSFSFGEDSWLPCSFYDYISLGLLKRYENYCGTFDKFLKYKKFLYGNIGIENKEKLDKNELSDELKKVLKKTGINFFDKKIKITTEEVAKKWIITRDENTETIYIQVENTSIEVYSIPELSENTLNTVYSYLLNDFANANYNHFRRNGNDNYLKNAIDLYNNAINKFPNNTIAKFNKSFVLIEQNETKEAINLLNEVTEKRPAWYEALIASVTLNLDLPEKINKIKKDNAITQDPNSELKTTQNLIKDRKDEIKKLQEKSGRIQNLNDEIKKLQEQSGRNQNPNEEINKTERIKGLKDEIKKLQEETERIKDLKDETKKLDEKSEKLKELIELEKKSGKIEDSIKRFLDSTKLFPLYIENENQSDNTINHISLINNKYIKWIRLDEDDVHALKLYSRYKNQDQMGRQLFNVLLKYYCPEDIDINLEINKDNSESMKMLVSNIQYWQDQDPSNYCTYRQYMKNLEKLYLRNLENYIGEGYKGLLELLRQDKTYVHDNDIIVIEKFFKDFEDSDIFKENPKWNAYVYYTIGNFLVKVEDYHAAIEKLTKAINQYNLQPEYYYELGVAYTNTSPKQWSEAIYNYKLAIERKKNLPDYPYSLDYYYNFLSEAYFKAGKLNEFLDIFEKSGDLYDKPDKKAIIYNRIANLLSDSKNEQEAIPYYEKAIELDPNRPIYLCNLGLTYTKLEQWQEAIENHKKAVEQRRQLSEDPYGLDYYYEFLSIAYSKAGRLKEFIDIFENSSDLNDKPDKKAIIYNRFGNLIADSNKEQEAIPYYEKAIELDPNKPIYLCNLGLTYTKLGQWDNAIKYHKQAIELRKKSSDEQYGLDYYYKFLSEAYFKADKLNEFLDIFEKSGDLNDSLDRKAIVFNRLGNLLADSKKDQESILYYEKAIALDPNRPIYLCNLGLTYAKLGQWQEAIENHKKAVELRKTLSKDLYELDYYYEYLSIAYSKAGRLMEFIDIFEKSGDLNDKPDKKAIIYNRLGNLLADSNKEQEAIPYYEKAIELDPNSPIYFCNLGLTHAKLEQWQEAIENHKKAVEQRRQLSEDPYGLDYYYDFLSETYFKAGKLNECLEIIEGTGYLNNNPIKKAAVYNTIGNSITTAQEAIPYYKNAIELDPNRPIYLSNLGLTYVNIKQWNEAIECHRQAVELRKKSPDDLYELDYYYEFLLEAYFKAGRLNEFLDIFEKSGDLNDKPDKKAIIYNRLGNLLADSNKEQEAIPYYEKAIELDPNSPIYLCNLGLSFSNLELWDRAIECHKQAIELRKKLPDDLYGLDYYNNFLIEVNNKIGKKDP